MLSAEQVRNALEMYISDYVTDESNIKKHEMQEVLSSFNTVGLQLMEDAEEDDEDEDEIEEDDEEELEEDDAD